MALRDAHEQAHATMDRLDDAKTPVEGVAAGEYKVGEVDVQDTDTEAIFSDDQATTLRRGQGRVAVATTLRVGLREHTVRAEILGERDAPYLTLGRVTKARDDREEVLEGPKGSELAARALANAATKLTQAAFRLP